MTQAVLNTQLYQKMFAEQEAFRAELMQLPPGEILQKAYEYVCREDILLSLEYNDLSPPAGKSPSEISHAAGGCVQKVG